MKRKLSKANANETATSDKKLPSPALQSIADGNVHNDDISQHQGRVRSFPHERGIWASFVYADYGDCDGLLELQKEWKELLDTTTTLQFNPIERIHLSLTKTFTIRHHNIAPFVDNLRERLAGHRRFLLEFSGAAVYVNEERTRTFVGLRVAEVSLRPLEALVGSLDECMQEYKLPLYYKDRAFHVSILWCLGDQEQAVRRQLPAIIPVFERVYEAEYCDINQTIRTLFLKCGNKSFNFELA
ncbi:U6 snRNA phosphodiesterase 1-like [Anopheles nili]|uniref:U6 snRNA phosphodiesterase 1-like n=1 Tax=Anopheles nili TaxID=185578 RepID=UPI00237B5ABD|nr:U6 snRNA phosphodiesterase 1-like [Anopheles nili]